MKSVMKYVALIAFALFALAVFALMMSFSYAALGRVYPGNMINQVMGLVLFDIGAVVWLITFAFKAEGGMQRAGALVCFIADFIGTLVLVALEVLIGGQTYVAVEPWVGQMLIYVFIAATVFNLAGIYFHHVMDPVVQSEIEDQSLIDDLQAEARRQAGEQNKIDTHDVGAQLAQRIQNNVRSRLGLPTLAENLFGAPVGEPSPVESVQVPPASPILPSK
jgi:hypothetical protein